MLKLCWDSMFRVSVLLVCLQFRGVNENKGEGRGGRHHKLSVT
jgi:hypothetical protein